MTIDFYYNPLSAPCRANLLTAQAIGLQMNLKKVDLMKKEQMKPEFIAINPQHCVPTMVDGDLKLWESRPICTYLASQYGKDDSLYPSNPKERALVDRLLYFDMGTLYHRFGEYVYPVLFGAAARPDPEKLAKIHEALGWLNGYLEGHQYVAGDCITVADHAIVASVSTFHEGGIDLSSHPNVVAWYKRCQTTMPGYKEANEEGAKMFGGWAKSKIC